MPPPSYQQYPTILTHHQNSRSWESFLALPGATNEQSSLSPSTSSPVTPTSNRGSVAVPYRRASETSLYRTNQISPNALSFSGTPETNLEQLGFSQQFGCSVPVDLESPCSFSSSGSLFHFAPVPEGSSIYHIPKQNDYCQSSHHPHEILSPQQPTVATLHNHPPGNPNDMIMRSIEDPRIYHSLAAGVLPNHRQARLEETFGNRSIYLDSNNNPDGWEYAAYESNTHSLPQHPDLVNSNSMRMDDPTMHGDANTMLDSSMLDYLDLTPTASLIKCSTCGQDFTGKFGPGNLKRHMRLKHHSNKTHKCHQCSKTYKRGDALRKHSWKTHRCLEAKPRKRKVRAVVTNGC
jgi:hypothetical protein